MGLFNTLMSKIFGHASSDAGGTSQSTASAGGSSGSSSQASAAPAATQVAPASAPATAVSTPAQPVDVAAILTSLASKNPEKLDWKRSIVDLMKLVGMESSLSARKELAKDLHYSGDMSDSATMNMWLHKEVMKKLAENGGKVPADLLAR